MFAGLRSRWTIPRSCAASQRLGDLARDGQRLIEPGSAPGDPVRQRRAFDELEDQRERPAISSPRVRGWRRCSDGSATRATARLRSNRASRSASVANEIREDFQGHVPAQLRVARAVDLAHAADANRRDDLIRTQASTGGQPHVCATSSSVPRTSSARRSCWPAAALPSLEPALFLIIRKRCPSRDTS